MKKALRHIFSPRATAVTLFLLLLLSCNNKELCFDHADHAATPNVHIEATYEYEWEYALEGGEEWPFHEIWTRANVLGYDDLRPAHPDGLRVHVYSGGDNESMSNLHANGGVLQLQPREYSFLLYNNDTKYVVINDTHDLSMAYATTRHRSRASYEPPTRASADEHTVNPPDVLYYAYVPSYVAAHTDILDTLHVVMQPLVYTYLVRYEFDDGLDQVTLARGALTGMAETVWLSTGYTSEKTATILFECEITHFGVQAQVHSFGATNGPLYYVRAAEGNINFLNLEVRLADGRLLSYFFDVTDQVHRQPRGGVITVSGITIPNDKARSGGSPFDVTVDDWDDYEDYNLEF